MKRTIAILMVLVMLTGCATAPTQQHATTTDDEKAAIVFGIFVAALLGVVAHNLCKDGGCEHRHHHGCGHRH